MIRIVQIIKRWILSTLYFFLDSTFVRPIIRFIVQTLQPRRDIRVRVHDRIMFANTLDRLMALYFWKFSILEDSETHLLQRLIKKDMVVLDIGANIGYYTLQFADWVGQEGKIFAFEPDPNNYSLLVKNIQANNIQNVIPVQKAVADQTQQIQLYRCEDHSGDHRIYDSLDGRQSVNVEAIALDDFFSENERVDFIKMDIQGAEYSALAGMERLIQQQNTLKILCEFSPNLLKLAGISENHFLQRITDYGLQLHFINEQRKELVAVTSTELQQLCRQHLYLNLLLIKTSNRDLNTGSAG